MIEYISASDHYKRVLTLCSQVKHILWIGTADIKDLYIEMGKQKIPFLGLLAKLIKQDVSVRLIHAKEPGPAFREDFDKYPVLFDGLERVLCPRVHFKMIIFGRTRQTLWRAVQMLTQKLCCQTIHDCPKVVPLHYESE